MGKRNSISHIKDIIKNSIGGKAIKEGFKIHLLRKEWCEIIGEKLYRNTSPLKIVKTSLYVKCAHQGWIQTLTFYKKDIIEKINVKFKDDFEIAEIKFVFGKISEEDFIEKESHLLINEKGKNSEFKPKTEDINELLKEFFKNCDRKTGQTNT